MFLPTGTTFIFTIGAPHFVKVGNVGLEELSSDLMGQPYLCLLSLA